MTDRDGAALNDIATRLARLENRIAGHEKAIALANLLLTDPVVQSAFTPSGFLLPAGFQMPNYGSVNADPGAQTATAAWTATEQTMLQAAYDLVRQFRTILTSANLGS